MDKEAMQGLHLALEAAIEQLSYAQQYATKGSQIGTPPTPEIQVIERALGEVTTLRNQIRERLMKELAKEVARPTLNVIK
jgi:hypothetical protein